MYMFQNGQTFLMTACQAGDVSIVKELLDSGLDPNGVDNVSSIVEKLLDSGLDPNRVDNVSNRTALTSIISTY